MVVRTGALFARHPIEGGEETGDVVVVAIGVLAQVVGDAEEPCGYVATFCVSIFGFIRTEEHVVSEVCRCFVVASQLPKEEALQASCIASVKFFECCIIAMTRTLHQFFVGHLPIGFEQMDAHGAADVVASKYGRISDSKLLRLSLL